jgi:aspartyl-tRNA synthetase
VLRSHENGSLRAANAGETVTLTGWVDRRRDHGGVAFIDLRDASGIVQVVVREDDAHQLRNETVIKATGTVSLRPEGNTNPNLPTGEIEIIDTTVEVLSEAAALPFQVSDHAEESGTVGEETRLRYRYLDLRRSGPAKSIRLRSDVNRAARSVLDAHEFVEIETPTLTRSTPEGARDFLVPARLKPGSWYALPQSPQLFKQLLQVAGMERYYQIARCYRDEDFRADRQPEFTQLDIEASFVEQEDIIALAEEILVALWKLIGYEITTPIPHITYHEAMEKYGSDKPDLRFGLELHNLTEFFADTPFRVFQSPYVGSVVYPGGGSLPRRQLDGWQDWAKQRGAKGLAYVLVGEDGTLSGPVAKNISDEEKAGLVAAAGAEPGDAIFFAAGEANASRALLGAARNEIAERTGLIKDGDWAFVWVVDAPLFESAAEAQAAGDVAVGEGQWTAVHHAFTAPKPEFLDTLESDPGSMGITEEEAEEKFGFLLEAFKFGAPPHGGIAFGWDRIVSLLAGVDSIREVIAFPKSGGGYDPLTAAPAPITDAQRAEAGVDYEPEDDDAEA